MADGSNASERAWYDNAHMNLDIVQIRGMRFVAHALKISEKAIEQSGILEDGRNTDWLNHPSIRLTILALAYLHGSDRRRNGGKLEITHQIAMAHNMANDPDLAGQLDTSRHRAFRAMKALIHDVQERVREINELKTHHRELDPEKILQAIVDYWDGTHFGRNELMRSGDHMTDRPGFTGAARIQNQADRTPTANQQDQHVRFYDKYDQASGDHAHFKQYLVDLQSGVIEPTLKELHQVTLAVRHAATKAHLKYKVVVAADKVRPELKSDYLGVAQDLEWIALDFKAEIDARTDYDHQMVRPAVVRHDRGVTASPPAPGAQA